MRLAVVGCSGRMGRALMRAVTQQPACVLVAAIERDGMAAVGQDASILVQEIEPGITVATWDAFDAEGCDGILDFTAPDASVAFAQAAAARGLRHIIGTTGFEPRHEEALADAAKGAAIVKAGNMSLGVNLLTALTRKVAEALDADFDIEVVEMHHRHKVDAPSGTALMLGEAAAAGRNVVLADQSVRVRDGHTGPRPPGAIGFATLRGGGVVGDHTVVFASEGERIELTHKADDRDIFARGAVKAALWARKRPPGLYAMNDVLGL
ncbi:MAG: 4-hydroxy-tetrahydrodipicolinate reductase [Pseudomonadota bacterium]